MIVPRSQKAPGPPFLLCFSTPYIKPGLTPGRSLQHQIMSMRKNAPAILLKLMANSHMTQSPCLLRRVCEQSLS